MNMLKFIDKKGVKMLTMQSRLTSCRSPVIQFQMPNSLPSPVQNLMAMKVPETWIIYDTLKNLVPCGWDRTGTSRANG
jgi:hypothetical protein